MQWREVWLEPRAHSQQAEHDLKIIQNLIMNIKTADRGAQQAFKACFLNFIFMWRKKQ